MYIRPIVNFYKNYRLAQSLTFRPIKLTKI